MMEATPTVVPKDEQQSVLQFLILENGSGSEIHTRICMMYGVQNVITNCKPMGTETVFTKPAVTRGLFYIQMSTVFVGKIMNCRIHALYWNSDR